MRRVYQVKVQLLKRVKPRQKKTVQGVCTLRMRHCFTWSPFADDSDPLVSMQNDRSSTAHARDCSASLALQELAAFAGTSKSLVYFRPSPQERPPSPCPWSRFCSPARDPPTPEPLPPDEYGGVGTKTRVFHLVTPRCFKVVRREWFMKIANGQTKELEATKMKKTKGTTARPFYRHTMAGFQ